LSLVAAARRDARSGVGYEEYRCVYGEDVEAGLCFLFNAVPLQTV
jgi:hypothetical protein